MSLLLMLYYIIAGYDPPYRPIPTPLVLRLVQAPAAAGDAAAGDDDDNWETADLPAFQRAPTAAAAAAAAKAAQAAPGASAAQALTPGDRPPPRGAGGAPAAEPVEPWRRRGSLAEAAAGTPAFAAPDPQRSLLRCKAACQRSFLFT